MVNISPHMSPRMDVVPLPDPQRQRQWQTPAQPVIAKVARDQQKPFVKHVNTASQQPDENTQRKKKKGKGGKKPGEAGSPGIGGFTLEGFAAAVGKLSAKMDGQREEHRQAMEAMRAQHKKAMSDVQVQLASVDDELQELHVRYRDLSDAVTQGDDDARHRVCRRILLDVGRETVQENVYGMPKGSRWIPFSKRFTSMEVFVAETLPLCEEKVIILSEDTLKEIWGAGLRDAGNVVTRDPEARNMHLERAIAALPVGSKDRNVLTEVFVCKFGRPPYL